MLLRVLALQPCCTTQLLQRSPGAFPGRRIVGIAEPVLSLGVALLRSFAVPRHRFRVFRGHLDRCSMNCRERAVLVRAPARQLSDTTSLLRGSPEGLLGRASMPSRDRTEHRCVLGQRTCETTLRLRRSPERRPGQVVCIAEGVLGTGVPMLSSLAKPRRGLSVVLRDSLGVAVYVAEVILSAGVSLPGGLAIPSHGFGVILGDAPAVVVCIAEVVLGFGVSLLSGFAEPAPASTRSCGSPLPVLACKTKLVLDERCISVICVLLLGSLHETTGLPQRNLGGLPYRWPYAMPRLYWASVTSSSAALTEPLDCFSVVPQNSFAVVVCIAEVALGPGMSLLGSLRYHFAASA